MKKRILSVLLAAILIFSSIPLTASAASYPTVMHDSMGMVIYCGETVPLTFTYFPAYNYENIDINVYSPDGELVANSNFEVSNKYRNYGSLTTTWDTADYEPGKYDIEIIKKFYSFYSWHTTPTNSSSFVTLVEPKDTTSLNNPYNGNKTHFEVSQSGSATATKKDIKNAYNAWKTLKVTNVSNPFEIQLTEMYIGDEAEEIAVDENMYNPNNNSSCQWVLTKFKIKNTGKSTVKASDLIDWTNAYLPTGEEATLIDTCTFGDLPNHSTEIAAGETKEAWFGFYLLKSQGIPYLKLDNGAYIYTHPDCAGGHKYSNSCDNSCNTCHGVRTTKHTYKTTVTKATLSKNGKSVKKCTACGNVAKTTTIKYAKTIKLSATSYTYDGKAKKPTVTVKDSSGKKLKLNTDYTVTYAKGRKKVGTYKVTVKMKGNYKGTKTLTFKINPKKTTVSKLTAGKKSLKVKISKKAVTGYEVQYSTSKKFTKSTTKTKTVKSYKTTSVTLKSLKAKKTYYVRVRTFKTASGKKYYSDWSSYKSKKTK